MRQALRRQLRSLWLGDITVIIAFICAYWLLRAVWGVQVFGNYSLLALLILCIILLEGSIYWWSKQRQLDKAPTWFKPKVVQFVYVFDPLLLLTYPTSLLIAMLNGTIESAVLDAVIGGAVYLFALLTFIHYFLVKLVRSDTDRRALTRRRQVDARFMRELQRSERRKGIL
jgi:hypothetical protein